MYNIPCKLLYKMIYECTYAHINISICVCTRVNKDIISGLSDQLLAKSMPVPLLNKFPHDLPIKIIYKFQPKIRLDKNMFYFYVKKLYYFIKIDIFRGCFYFISVSAIKIRRGRMLNAIECRQIYPYFYASTIARKRELIEIFRYRT